MFSPLNYVASQPLFEYLCENKKYESFLGFLKAIHQELHLCISDVASARSGPVEWGEVCRAHLCPPSSFEDGEHLSHFALIAHLSHFALIAALLPPGPWPLQETAAVAI